MYYMYYIYIYIYIYIYVYIEIRYKRSQNFVRVREALQKIANPK